MALKKDLLPGSPTPAIPSPDGKQLLYWGDDANFWTLDVATAQKHNVTKDAPVSFANTEDDHNNIVPPPRQVLGWSKDASAVLLSDGWDVWRLPVNGTGKAVNLTSDGRKNQIRYQRLYAFAAGATAARSRGRAGGAGLEEGIDLTKPLYLGTYGEWTKKEGLSRVDVGKSGATPLVWNDASYSLRRRRTPPFISTLDRRRWISRTISSPIRTSRAGVRLRTPTRSRRSSPGRAARGS